jgi:hypothetical protein
MPAIRLFASTPLRTALPRSRSAINVGKDKFSISIPANRAADSLVEWLRKNIRAMADRPRCYDEIMVPRKRRVSETELKRRKD